MVFIDSDMKRKADFNGVTTASIVKQLVHKNPLDDHHVIRIIFD